MEYNHFGAEVEEYLALKGNATRRSYSSAFELFLQFYHKKYGEEKGFGDFLDRIFEEFKKPPREQKRIAEIELVQFINFLKDKENFEDKKERSNNTLRLYFAAVQNFLKYKQVMVSGRFIGNLPSPVEKKENHKHEWTIEQIKQFVDLAPSYREKAIITGLFQSGLGVNELCELNYGDIREEYEKGIIPLCLKLVRKKTGVQVKTFFGRDAVKYLRLYLATRRDLTSESPLFVKERERKGDERITQAAIQQSFSEIAKGLSFIKDNGGFNPARPHSLRAAFKSQLTNKISDELVEFWMGHAGVLSRAYLNIPTDKLRELYMGAEEFLKIEKTSRDELFERKSRETRIPPETQKTIEELKVTIGTLSERNVELRNDLKTLGERFDASERKFEHFSRAMDLTPEETTALSEIIRDYLMRKRLEEDHEATREEAKERAEIGRG